MSEHSPYPKSLPLADGDPGDSVDLELLATIVRRRARLAGIVCLVVLVAGTLHSFLQQPVYQARATILIVGAAAKSLSLSPTIEAAAARLNIYAGPTSQGTALALLKGLDLIEQAAKALNLKTPLAELRDSVAPESIPQSELISLSVENGQPAQAAALANKLAELYVADSGRYARESSERATVHLRDSLAKVRADLNQAEDAIAAYGIAHGLSAEEIDTARLSAASSALDQQKITARMEYENAARTADYYRRRLAEETQTVVSSASLGRNPVIVEAESDLAKLEVQRAGLSATHGPEHAAVKELDRSIAQARAEINRAVATVVTGQVETRNPAIDLLAAAEAQARGAQAREAALRQLSARLAARLANMPREQVELGRLKRRAELDAQLYTGLMQQYQSTAAAAEVNEPTAVVASPARTPTEPVRPRHAIDLALTGVLALILAAMVGAMAELLDTRLHTAEDVQTHLQLPVLAQLTDTAGLPLLLSGETLDSALADQLRLLRRELRQGTRGSRPRTILVASTDPGDGRTTVALNLGVVSAQAGERALVVEADLRGRGLAQVLPDLGQRPALSAVLGGDAPALAAVQTTCVPGLQVVAAGNPSRSPVALLDASATASAWAAWADAADVVFVDSPPVAKYADALLIAPLCDAVLVVVRRGSSARRAARRTVEQLLAVGATVAGVVINRA